MKVLVITLLFLFVLVAGAVDQTILHIEQDDITDGSSYTLLKLQIDERGMPILLSREFYSNFTFNSGSAYLMKTFIEGIILVESPNPMGGKLEVIKLSLKPDGTGGGLVKIIYLVDGVWNTKKEMMLKLVKQNNIWVLVDMKGKVVPKLRIILNRSPLLGVVGISNIVPF